MSSSEIFLPSNKILMATLILLPALFYAIPTVTNNKEINIHDTKIENEITTTTVIQSVSGGIVNILGGGSMDYSE